MGRHLCYGLLGLLLSCCVAQHNLLSVACCNVGSVTSACNNLDLALLRVVILSFLSRRVTVVLPVVVTHLVHDACMFIKCMRGV